MNARVVNTISEYFKTKPVEKAWVFGSFSRNEEREDSDIDIMVELSPDARMGLSYFAMICDLEDRLNRRVDMVREGQLLPFAVDVEIMWLVINDDLPILKRQIEGYLSE